MSGSLDGRHAIITGASQGLGRAIAEAYVAAGASVLLCARDGALAAEVAETLRSQASTRQRIESMRADVAVADEVDALVARALTLFPRVEILVNNAGIYGPMGSIETVDWPAWVRAIEINLLGSVLCCRAILPHMKAQRYGKIVQLSGGGATQPLPNISAYAASKAAIVRFAESLALEVADFRIDVNAVAPGALQTRLLDELLANAPETIGEAFYHRMAKLKDGGATPLEVGAGLCVFLGASVSDGITGKLLSAHWDPWRALPEHLEIGRAHV